MNRKFSELLCGSSRNNPLLFPLFPFELNIATAMKLRDINKIRYRKHLNIVIVVLITGLMVMALGFGQALIALFGSGDGDNFILNLTGVILACAVCLLVLTSIRHHEFMIEVYYVWSLKQNLNKIYRKLKKIEAAKDEGDVNAIIVLNFYYEGSRQIFNLDDNTLTMDSLQLEINKLHELIEAKNIAVLVSDYNPSMLERF